MPATVFVATGKVDGETEFWWDELEGLLICTPDLPASLDLTLHGRTHSWSLAQSPEEYPQIADSGAGMSPTPLTLRRATEPTENSPPSFANWIRKLGNPCCETLPAGPELLAEYVRRTESCGRMRCRNSQAVD